MNAKITVVIPVYNVEHSIKKSINSLLNQSFEDWCCIIVNDGSTDNTKNILESIDDARFVIITFDKNKGRPHARQAALEMVKTKYMCMLDGDDFYYPHKLEIQFYFMEHNPEITLMSTAWAIVDKDNTLYSIVSIEGKIKKYRFEKHLDFVNVPHASSIIRMSDVKGLEFNTNLKLGQDTDFMRRLLLGKNYVLTDEVTYAYNRDQSFSLGKYIRSVNYTIESIYTLPISKFSKFKEFLKLKLKIGIVFLIVKAGGLKWYLNKMGRTPNRREIEEFEKIKESL